MPHTHLIPIRQVLNNAIESLVHRGFQEARLEAEVLLSYVMKLNRAELILHLEDVIATHQLDEFSRLVERRLNYEPVAYLTGKKEFFGLDFQVNLATLIPRPETELLVEKVLELANERAITIADIGTGCGAIAVTLAVQLPNVKIYATDISSAALKIAQANAQAHDVSKMIRFFKGDLLEPIDDKVDIVVANLPYISDWEMLELNEDVRFYEPELALTGGKEGLNLIERLLSQACKKPKFEGIILLEIGCTQEAAVVELITRYFPCAEIDLFADLCGHDRVVMIYTGSTG